MSEERAATTPAEDIKSFQHMETFLRGIKKKDDIFFNNNRNYADNRKILRDTSDELVKHLELYLWYVRLLKSMKVQSVQREILMKKIEEEAPYMEDAIRYLN